MSRLRRSGGSPLVGVAAASVSATTWLCLNYNHPASCKGQHCHRHDDRLPSLTSLLSCSCCYWSFGNDRCWRLLGGCVTKRSGVPPISLQQSCAALATSVSTSSWNHLASSRRRIHCEQGQPTTIPVTTILPRTWKDYESRDGEDAKGDALGDDDLLRRMDYFAKMNEAEGATGGEGAVVIDVDKAEDSNKEETEESLQSSFPNLKRHGRSSLLREYLTEDVYQELRDRTTSMGVSIEDVIRGGVALPWGSRPPRGVAGIYAGDAESYKTFASLFNPIIEVHHKDRKATTTTRSHTNSKRMLQRHRTNLNPKQLRTQRLDPEGRYILYTRMRLARSLDGFRFPTTMRRSERRVVENLIRDCTKDWRYGQYVSVMEMDNLQHEDLVQRHLLFPDPDCFDVSAGFGRDWPDGRGVFYDTMDEMPNLMIWCNAYDHVWIISNAKGGDVQSVFTRMSTAVWGLETSLMMRGYSFIEDYRLGFLNSSPGDIGTALRASVFVKLIRLGQKPGFFDLIRRLKLEAKSEYSSSTQQEKRYTGIFDIANAEALGKTEVELINIMIDGVACLIDLEKRLEKGEIIDLGTVQPEE